MSVDPAWEFVKIPLPFDALMLPALISMIPAPAVVICMPFAGLAPETEIDEP